ncbi:MAG: response regulator transcription factor [Thermomicrobiales bacterium]|nr:response regulator transcription factor [Thermomicrobiales bacterium]
MSEPRAGTLLPIPIVAAYPATRAGLAALLAGDPILRPVAAGPDLAGDPPAAIVVDLTAPGEPTVDDLAEAWPAVPLVLIGGDPTLDGPGLSDGPVAYLPADVDGPTLAAAVYAVLAGLIAIDPQVATFARFAPPTASELTPASAANPLSPRELEVLRLVADGLPNKAIARELGISEHTVKFHVGSVLGKLGAGSRTEAVTLATRRGLLTV